MGQDALEFFKSTGAALTAASYYSEHSLEGGAPVTVDGTVLSGGYVYADDLDSDFKLTEDNPETGVFGFVAKNTDTNDVVVSLRGTATTLNVYADVTYTENRLFDAARDQTADYLFKQLEQGNTVQVLGHSYTGAPGQDLMIAVFDLIDTSTRLSDADKQQMVSRLSGSFLNGLQLPTGNETHKQFLDESVTNFIAVTAEGDLDANGRQVRDAVPQVHTPHGTSYGLPIDGAAFDVAFANAAGWEQALGLPFIKTIHSAQTAVENGLWDQAFLMSGEDLVVSTGAVESAQTIGFLSELLGDPSKHETTSETALRSILGLGYLGFELENNEDFSDSVIKGTQY